MIAGSKFPASMPQRATNILICNKLKILIYLMYSRHRHAHHKPSAIGDMAGV